MLRFIFLFFSLTISFMTHAQKNLEEFKVSDVVFIKDAKVTTHYDRSPQTLSISIDHGIITNIGRNIQPPSNAIIIDAKDSLYVYPAFIDPCSHTGQQVIKDQDPKDMVLMQPANNAKSHLVKDHESIKNMRKAGFSISNSVPYGRMLPGKSYLYFLDQSNQPVISNFTGFQYAQFSGIPNAYPTTMLGIIAQYKETFAQVAHYKDLQKLYLKNPTKVRLPNYDSDLNQLIPIVNQEELLIFKASRSLRIARLIQLKKELDIPITIAEAAHFEPYFDEIKRLRMPLFLSLKFPKEPSIDSTITDKELKHFQERRKESYNQQLQQVKLLEEENYDFSFSYLNVKPGKIHENLKKLKDIGVQSSTLLKALTYSPAKYLKIEKFTGSLEKGKMANLIILQDELFSDAFQLKYSMTNGYWEEFELKEKSKKGENDSNDPYVGEWSFDVTINNTVESGILNFSKTDDKITGTIAHENDRDNTFPLKDITWDDGTLKFHGQIFTDGQSLVIEECVMHIEDGKFEGEITLQQFGTFDIEGIKKTPKS